MSDNQFMARAAARSLAKMRADGGDSFGAMIVRDGVARARAKVL